MEIKRVLPVEQNRLEESDHRPAGIVARAHDRYVNHLAFGELGILERHNIGNESLPVVKG